MAGECEDCAKGHCDRWDHLVERVRSQRRPLAAVVASDDAILMTDAVDRCDCGGVFGPDPGGKTVCGCCGAPKSFAVKVFPETEVGRTLREHLLERRRTGVAIDRKLTDEDVKVTMHG